MEAVRTRLGDCINDSARGFTVLRREASCQYRELLNGIHAEGGADHIARSAVGVVVNADTIEPVIVVRRSLPRDGEFRSEAAVAAR